MTVQKTRCVFRADGNSEIGWGHVMRSLALATIIREEFECIFAIQAPSAQLSEQIIQSGCQLVSLPVSDSIQDAHHLVSEHIRPKDIIVLDGYNFSVEYQRIIKNNNNTVVCIDDLSASHFLADAIINPAGNVNTSAYSKEWYTKLYTGPRYALLRKPFLEIAQNKSNKHNFDKVLISMGGADPDNHTLKIVKQLPLTAYREIHIIVGGAYLHRESLEQISIPKHSIFIHTSLSAEEMCSLMSECGTAICSASTVSYEYCCVGGLLFVVKTADNQTSLYNFLISEGLALSFETFTEDSTAFTTKTDALLQKQAYYFDGSSSHNLLKIFQDLSVRDRILVRKATLDDMALLYHWANDPAVRRYAYHPEPIKWEVHQEWFQKKITSTTTHIYIFYLPDFTAEIPIAQIRFDVQENEAMISYLIDQQYRGKGLGGFILTKGVEKLLQDQPFVTTITGYVKQDNIASCKSFEKATFDVSLADEPLPYADSRKYTLNIK